MPNSLTASPYEITAAMPASLHKTAGTTGPLTIQSLTWQSPAKTGDAVTVTDGAGHTIAQFTAASTDVANGSMALLVNKVVPDFQVVTINSGTLTVTTPVVAAPPVDNTPKGGSLNTRGTEIPAGTAQLQGYIALQGCTSQAAVAWSLANSLPESWQAGITVFPVVLNGQVDIYLINTTAVGLTPVSETINVRLLK